MGHFMRQFWAILRDSYREAVDGWVITIMLALGAVVIALCASMGFKPLPAEEALPKIVQSFSTFLPQRGEGRNRKYADCDFLASDIQKVEEGFRFELTVLRAKPSAPPLGDEGERDTTPPQGPPPAAAVRELDTFRETVARWLQEEDQQKSQSAQKPLFFVNRPQVSAQEQQAVRPADMEAFLTQQFQFHAALPAQVHFREKRATSPNHPTYIFDVTVRGGVSVRGWPHTVTMFFGAVTLTRETNLGLILYVIEDQIINGLGGFIALLLSVIITASFIPNLLRKGSIDLIISKPIGRMTLLAYKYIGGLIFILIITTFTIGGVWLALALRSGYWNPAFLVVIPLLTFTFAILYAVSTLVATLSRSAMASIIVTLIFMLFLYIVGQVKTISDNVKKLNTSNNIPAWVVTTIDTLNNALPRYKDLDKLTTKILSDGTLTTIESTTFGLRWIEYPSWWNTLGVSLLYIVVLVGLAGLWFRSRDY